MAKKVAGFVKLQIPAGKANPAPPVGTALGPQGINIMAFCKEFNARTQGMDTILPVEVTIFTDKSFTFILKTPPAAVLLKKEAGVEKGSGQPNRVKVGSVTEAQVRKIAEVTVARLEPGDVSEDVAARDIAAAAAGEGVRVDRAFTGRCNLFAETAGVMVVDKDAIDRLNGVDEAITFATLPAFRAPWKKAMLAADGCSPAAIYSRSVTPSVTY